MSIFDQIRHKIFRIPKTQDEIDEDFIKHVLVDGGNPLPTISLKRFRSHSGLRRDVNRLHMAFEGRLEDFNEAIEPLLEHAFQHIQMLPAAPNKSAGPCSLMQFSIELTEWILYQSSSLNTVWPRSSHYLREHEKRELKAPTRLMLAAVALGWGVARAHTHFQIQVYPKHAAAEPVRYPSEGIDGEYAESVAAFALREVGPGARYSYKFHIFEHEEMPMKIWADATIALLAESRTNIPEGIRDDYLPGSPHFCRTDRKRSLENMFRERIEMLSGQYRQNESQN